MPVIIHVIGLICSTGLKNFLKNQLFFRLPLLVSRFTSHEKYVHTYSVLILQFTTNGVPVTVGPHLCSM